MLSLAGINSMLHLLPLLGKLTQGLSKRKPPTSCKMEGIYMECMMHICLASNTITLIHAISLGKEGLLWSPCYKENLSCHLLHCSQKSLQSFPEFQQSMPLKALTLVATMVDIHNTSCCYSLYTLQVCFILTMYKNNAKDTNPNLNGKELENAYNNFLQTIQLLTRHCSKGLQLDTMLADWAFNEM